MTIAFVNSSITNVGPPFVPSEYAGAASGDFVLAYGLINSSDGVWSLPADFTQIDQFTETLGSVNNRVFIGFKIRGANAGNGYSFGYDGTDLAARVALLGFSGDSLGLDVTYAKSSHYNATSNDFNAAAKAITTETNGAAVFLAYLASGGTIDTTAPPSGYTQRLSATGTVNIYGCSIIVANFGTETPGDFTHTEATGGQDQRTFTIAIAELSTSKLAVFRRIRGY